MSDIKGTVYYKEKAWNVLMQKTHELKPSKIFIIVDENTENHCFPYFLSKTDCISSYHIVRIPSGEKNKNIQTCLRVWEELSELGADRSSLIINLGGGVLTDLGGFVASTMKRGLTFINIPTTLLSMVDASVGGKNGVDLGYIKNQIGTVQLPIMVIVDITFLETLPLPQIYSGMAEMIKHALIDGDSSWYKIREMDPRNKNAFEKLIQESIDIKNKIVLEDPLEKGKRKILNYGHTLGHAIESYFMDCGDRAPLLHGEAIAVGMILATYFSYVLLGLEKEKLEKISELILRYFPKQNFSADDIEHIQNLTIYDKKNRNGQVLFVLMRDFGKFEIDSIVDKQLIIKGFNYYKSL